MPSDTAIANLPPGPQAPPRAKRAQVLTACEECRRQKCKCDGVHPTCQRCRRFEIECIFATEQGVSRVTTLKRKHTELLRQSAGEHELLHQLRALSRSDAHQVLDRLRNNENVDTVLQFSKNLPAPVTEAETLLTAYRDRNLAEGVLTSVPNGFHASATSLALDLNSGKDRPNEIPLFRPRNLLEPCAQTLPSIKTLISSLGDHTDALSGIEQRKSIRRSPSAPDLQHKSATIPSSVPQTPQWSHDSRVDRADVRDWGITYVGNETFRNIVSSYLVWDHPTYRFFDEDDFMDGLVHAPSISCNKCLVHTVIAHGALNYIHIEPEVATAAAGAAVEEAKRLWNEEAASDDSIAMAAAGMLLWITVGAMGQDKLAAPYILRAKHAAVKMGFFSVDAAPRAFASPDAKSARAKAVFAWGLFAWSAMAEAAHRLNYNLPNPPHVPLPHAGKRAKGDEWMPWPRTQPRLPAFTDEVLSARGSVAAILNEVIIMQRKFADNGLTKLYLDASTSLYYRLRRIWDSIDPVLYSLENPTPQLLLLHFLYHYTIMEIFRSFTTTPAFPSPHSTPLRDAKLPTEPATSASISASQQLRRLLHKATTSPYAGLQTPMLSMHIAVLVAFETLPFAHTLSPSFSHSASMTFLTALRFLSRMRLIAILFHYTLLGIKQAAARAQYTLPSEARAIFEDAERERPEGHGRRSLRAGYILDLSRSRTDVQAARLDDVLSELDALAVE